MNRRRQQRSKKQRQGYVLIALCVLVAIGAITWFVYTKSEFVARSAETLCREDGLVIRETVIMIDATDGYSHEQSMVAKQLVSELLDNALIDERFTVYAVSENMVDQHPLVQVCNSGNAEGKSALTSNISRIDKRWREQFFDVVTAQIDALIGASEANYSPILETLKWVSAEVFFGSKAPQKQLIIVSDLLQHTREYSHYRGAFGQMPKGYAQSIHAYLENVDVTVLYIYRSDQYVRQTNAHVDFWLDHIGQSGGIVNRVKRLN